MPENRYHQYCALARALDVAGDRWTLLIVRELIPGPRRFTDLIDGLPGVSRNLLTERLRDLELHGVVTRQELPAPAARQVYALTEDGRDLAHAMVPLIAWGAKRLGDRKPADSFRPRWAAVAMATFVDREAAKGVRETYQYRVGDTAFYFTVDDGSIEVRDGTVANAAATVVTDDKTWSDIASGKVTAADATSTGALAITGDPQAANHLRKLLSRRQVLAQATSTLDRVAASRKK
jgi:DNA-binding HxlR family transcriptional regulator/putative sterol carrier protein